MLAFISSWWRCWASKTFWSCCSIFWSGAFCTVERFTYCDISSFFNAALWATVLPLIRQNSKVPLSVCHKQAAVCGRVTVQRFLLHTSSTGHWATAQAGIQICASFPLFSWRNFLVDTYRQGKCESSRSVAAFCFAFVSKQMHSCHSRSHWRLLSNVIASKLIPMDARLQIQLFQVSVKGMLQRGMQQSFKYMNLNTEGAQALLFTSGCLKATQYIGF